ncbi:MAG: carbamoyl-phosphate synthase large subunit, partial [Gemmatimonadales bacterium]
FEPTLDYIVVKVPRFNFDKFPESDDTLTTRMKSVGEAMAIGGSFKEALQKALRSLEDGRSGFVLDGQDPAVDSVDWIECLRRATPMRYRDIAGALQAGVPVTDICEATSIDPWFLGQMADLVETAMRCSGVVLGNLDADELRDLKRNGFSDTQIAHFTGSTEDAVRQRRIDQEILPVFKTVDTCAAEFEAFTPYHYSTYDGDEDEVKPGRKRRVVILGAGPNRIGQGIEFDYCCVRACIALREAGYEVVMVNCNPETVSTDYDIADVLYFEPLTLEDVYAVCDREQPIGVMVQLGGQTPLKLAKPLESLGVPILGTSVENIKRAEDRGEFQDTLHQLRVSMPAAASAETLAQALREAAAIGYPVLVRPSFVLGGRGMAVAYDDESLESILRKDVPFGPGNPLEIISFLEDAFEYDVDAVCDGERTVIAGVMQHIQEAGVHSGDSACTIPPFHAPPGLMLHIREITERLAHRFDVRGLMNIQIAVKDGEVYVLEVNPRASRTVPFVSKATGVQWARVAALAMMGESLAKIGTVSAPPVRRVAVKEAVFPFDRFPEADPVLGPEMRSTGEVMGIDWDFGRAFAKSQMAGGLALPVEAGLVFISVHDRDKPVACHVGRRLHSLGFRICATSGTTR